MPVLFYAINYIFPLITFYAFWHGGWLLWFIPFEAFVLIPLLEVTRHSDHHAHPKRPYSILRHFDAGRDSTVSESSDPIHWRNSGYPAEILLEDHQSGFLSFLSPQRSFGLIALV